MAELESSFFAQVQVMGHVRLAGRVSEHTVAGAAFVRVDVPETGTQPAFTRLFNPSSIYSIDPISEEMARDLAERINAAPVQAYDVRLAVEKLLASKAKTLAELSEMGIDNDDEKW